MSELNVRPKVLTCSVFAENGDEFEFRMDTGVADRVRWAATVSQITEQAVVVPSDLIDLVHRDEDGEVIDDPVHLAVIGEDIYFIYSDQLDHINKMTVETLESIPVSDYVRYNVEANKDWEKNTSSGGSVGVDISILSDCGIEAEAHLDDPDHEGKFTVAIEHNGVTEDAVLHFTTEEADNATRYFLMQRDGN